MATDSTSRSLDAVSRTRNPSGNSLVRLDERTVTDPLTSAPATPARPNANTTAAVIAASANRPRDAALALIP